jgi:hypothetical protein
MYGLVTKSGFARVFGLAVVFGFVVFVGCSETSVDVADGPSVTPGDTSLPNGFVSKNRPPEPALSFSVPCPLAEVPGGVDNPNVTLGCPFVECIPAIDTPDFATVREAGLSDFERVVAVEMDGQVKGLPIRILMYHEVVNLCWNLSDGSTQYSAVTYCPIVDVAVHFIQDFPCDKPTRGTSYGVSSGLYNGNLIIYKRETAGDPTFSFVQMYGGGLSPNCLEIKRVNIDMPASLFTKLYPTAEVLTENTGLPPPPGGYDLFDHPYAEFWLSNDLCVNGLCFPISSTDDRLGLKEYVYGVYTPTETKAYPIDDFRQRVVRDQLGGVNIVVFQERGATVAFESVVDGQQLTFSFLDREGNGLPLFEDEETGSLWTFDGIAVRGPLKGKRLPQMVGYRAFWFAWAAFFPQTLLHEF